MARKNKIAAIAGILLIVGASAAGLLYAYWDQAVPLAGMAVNFVRTLPAATSTRFSCRWRWAVVC